MASKVCRCIQLWLILLLCWFVLRSDPVTQESESESENLSMEKVNLGFTEQEATPPLVSIHHTETIIPDNFDQTTFVKRPAIAPATPWDDTLILSTVSEQSARQVSTEHKIPPKGPIPSDLEIPSPVENNEELQSTDDNGPEGVEVDDFGTVGEDHIKKMIQSLDPEEKVERQDSMSEFGDGGAFENVEDQNQSQERMENELPETEQFKISEDEVNSKSNQNTNKLLQAKELPAEPGHPQTTEGDEDLTGIQDGLEGTQDGVEGTQEDMPSFNEWSQKFLAQEEEKKVQQINEKGSLDPGTQQKKKNVDRKQNNFASVDCGANIPEKNPEAQNAHSILLENKDLYMLNPCTANIWFIVELCDHVHVTSLQLANFEMFSSTIEKFQVSFSTRYPTREWSQLQGFVAKPEKSIQNFTIDPIFAKYIKVEQLSHHGSEHYCPWSLLRVYGNSMVEEYEEHESSLDGNPGVVEDDSTSTNTTEDKHVSQGYLQSATDAVLNFVKETAKKLVNTDEEHTNSTDDTPNATKYPEDNSSQPLPQKTIVQLMPREDFEASCHGDSAETPPSTCLPGSGCGSTEYSPHSHQAFLEIVHNVCAGNLKNAKTCFTNFSKTLVGNNTNGKRNPNRKNDKFSSSTDEQHVDSPTLGETESRNAGVEECCDSTVSDPVQELNEHKPEVSATSSQIPASEDTSTSKSDRVQTEAGDDSPVSSTVLPSKSTSSTRGRSSVEIGTASDSVTTSIDDFDCASSPIPLAQPPLAVDEEPALEEPPTQPGAIWESGQLSPDTPKSVPSDEGSVDSSTATETISKVIANPTSTYAHETVTASSIVMETTAQTAERISTTFQDGSRAQGADGEPVEHDGHKGSHGGNREHERYKGTPRDNKEHQVYKGDKEHDSFRGTQRDNKEHEDIPNPHVDVLKITLTDAETKEGTAEPEQADEDKPMSSDLGTGQNETVVSPVGEGNAMEDLVKSGTAIDYGNLIEKDPKEVETHNTDRPGSSGKQDESENTQVGMSVEEKSENIENAGEADIQSKDHDQKELTGTGLDTNTINKDASGPPDGQCEMKDAANSKNPEEPSLSNIDPGPTVQAEAAHTHGNTNGKKESIFVAMSRKIKALEQNVTMTNLFLEELSQRYRKSMDDMQRKMEKKFTVMSRNSKLLTKVNLSQNSTILALTTRIEQLEEKLNEATSRLKVVNQEVVERHVLGMCLQFVFVFILWFLLRRSVANTGHAARHAYVGNGHLKNGGVLCNETDYRQQSGTFQDTVQEKHSLEEFDASKPLTPEGMSDSKRRRRRKHRPNSIISDHALDDTPNQSQNIVSESAGLLFHTPGSHDSIRPRPKHADALRSCSADSLNSLTQDEHKPSIKPKSAFSPKSKKVFSRNKKDADELKSRTCASQARFAREPHAQHTRLVRSRSSGECYENKLALSDIALSTPDPNISLGNSRCSLQSTNDPLKDRKSRWIWGLG